MHLGIIGNVHINLNCQVKNECALIAATVVLVLEKQMTK